MSQVQKYESEDMDGAWECTYYPHGTYNRVFVEDCTRVAIYDGFAGEYDYRFMSPEDKIKRQRIYFHPYLTPRWLRWRIDKAEQ